MPGKLRSEISADQQNSDSVIDNTKDIPLKNDTLANNEIIKTDSIPHKSTDTSATKKEIKIAYTATVKKIKKDSSTKRQIYFAAGLGLYQQLPVDGQKLVPYNSLGRKSTLADYVPSIYFRMYQDKKWFVQSEFRYGAPQNTKEIIYKQQKLIDTNSNTTFTTSTKLKKTFYHQLPISFNYFLLPKLSVGAGISWNRFSNAIIEKEDKATNNITMVDSIQVRTITHSQKPDSNFVTSYFQALFETQYELKRLSFGARYSFGLQPYIKFQLPGGQKQEEKNSSLQVFIRYNLWESGKDKSKR